MIVNEREQNCFSLGVRSVYMATGPHTHRKHGVTNNIVSIHRY